MVDESDFDDINDIDDEQEIDNEPQFKEGDRVEWRTQKGEIKTGTFLEDAPNDFLIVAGDVPVGEPCPLLWGPPHIFTKVG